VHRLSSLAPTLLLGAVLLVAGCTRFTEGTNLSCPRAVFLGGTDTLVRFAPDAARTERNVAAQFELYDMQYSCRISSRRAEANVTFAVSGMRRSSAVAENHEVPYFIVVTNQQGAVVAKHNFTARLRFPAGGNAATITERVEVTLPLAEGQRAVGFELVVGIQLTREELDYNLARR